MQAHRHTVPRAVLVVFYTLLSMGFASAARIDCPLYIDDIQRLATDQPGWIAKQNITHHPLLYATLAYSDGSSIIGSERIAPSGRLITTWTLDHHAVGDPYLACTYDGTSTMMLKSIDRSYSACRLLADNNSEPPAHPEFTCLR